MKEFVLDANALVRIFRNQSGAGEVQELFIQSDKGQARLRMSAVNLTEVLYVCARYSSVDEATRAIRKVSSLVEFVPVSTNDCLAAAELRLKYKLGLADCFAAELSIRLGAALVTADPEFARLGRQLKLLTLPRHSS